MAKAGLIMVVDGPLNVYREALAAVTSIRDQMPELSLLWATSVPHYRCELVDHHLDLAPRSPFVSKVDACLESPFERTILLDADTFLIRPIWALVEALNESDFVICQDLPYEYFFNTGVVSFNSRGAALMAEASARLHAIPPSELTRGNREQKVVTELLHQGASRRLGIAIGFADPLEYNARRTYLETMDESELERVRVVHVHGLSREMDAHFPRYREKLENAQGYAARVVADVVENTHRYAEAIRAMRRVIDANPSTVESYFALATLHEAAGELDSAIAVLHESRKALNTEPGKALYMTAQLENRAKRRYPAVRTALQAALAASEYYHPVIQGTKNNAIRFARRICERLADDDLTAALAGLSEGYECTPKAIAAALERAGRTTSSE